MIFTYILLGVLVGIFSGIVGVGGGIILVPVLTYFFKFSQHMAQGTTLAMLVLPTGLLATWVYYKQGYVDLRIAVLIALGFFIGGFFGAKIAVGIPDKVLSMIFGAVLILVGLKMILFPK